MLPVLRQHIRGENKDDEERNLIGALDDDTKRLENAYRNMPFDEKDNDEWVLVALVMDKMLSWGFLSLLILSSSMVLIVVPSAQNVHTWE